MSHDDMSAAKVTKRKCFDVNIGDLATDSKNNSFESSP